MKIAMLAQKMELGYGVDVTVHNLCAGLARLGYRVDVFVAWYDVIPTEYKMFIAQPIRIPHLNKYWQDYLLVDARMLRTVKQLRRYDLIVTHDPIHIVGAISKILNIAPVVMYHYGLVPVKVLPDIPYKLESLRASLLWKISSLLADSIIVNSFFTKDKLTNWAIAKTLVNYPGVEHMTYQGTDRDLTIFREYLRISDSPVMLWVGRLSSPYKGLRNVVQIYKVLRQKKPELRLLIVGKGSEEDAKLLRCIEGAGVLVNASTEELRKCYAICDIFVSTSQWEGFNMPLVEAQANGRPVVAYRLGAHLEVVKHGKTGFLAKNDEEFVEFVLNLLSDDNLRKSMGAEAANYSKQFNWSSHINLFQSVAERLIDSNASQHTS